ncbi:T9SS type B sorting domain-containing protein [Lutibacter sp.]
MKNKLFFIIIFVFNIVNVQAQREAGIWYFGNEAGLDFNSGSPVALTNGQLVTNEGCSTISDINGNLLFYTDGTTIWNANHTIMVNGSGLLGHKSSTQSAIIVPNPNNPAIYYIFTVDQPNDKNADNNPGNNEDDGINNGLNYTEVNMSLQGGLGAVNITKKNIHLITYDQNNTEESNLKASEKITAVQSANGSFYWVITHFTNKFYAFKVTNSGVNKNPIISTTSLTIPTGGYLPNAIGYLKSSPNGKKIGIVHLSSRLTNDPNPKGGIVRNTGKVMLYDFDNTTGVVSNPISLLSAANPYGIEFSSKSKKLYVTTNHYNNDGNTEGSSLLQYNLESSNIASSKVLIKKNDFVAGALQLAIDEKIYRSGYKIFSNGGDYLSVIKNPEADGTACNFTSNVINLNGKKALLGLPPFIQSLFLFNFKYEFTCFGDATHFSISTLETIDTVLWDFGDGTTSTDLDTYHTYASPGTYQVTLIKTVNGEVKEPILKEVIIKDRPIILNTIFELIQCDSYDSNPNDSLGIFNLENSIEALTLDNADNFNVYFYLNDIAADGDTYNENSLPNIFSNTLPNQILTAKIIYKDSNCYSLGKIKLTAVSSTVLSVTNIDGCDLGDGTAEFNLTAKESEIITSLNLPNTISIIFYETEENAINNFNPLSSNYISPSKAIFFKAENNGVCYGAGKFYLKVNYFPPIDLEETIFVCDSSFPITINPDIPLNLQQNYTYNWSNNENTYAIPILNEQVISLTIIDKALLCEKVKTFKIIKVSSPVITKVKVDINTSSITVHTKNNFENLYILDNPYGSYQEENTFFNVNPGAHIIYVKNKYNCTISFKKFFVLGFPKFLTPNNDGINDTWEVKGLDFANYTYSSINIFNRYGKHIATIKPNATWNGLYNEKMVSSGDYWFSINITDNEQKITTYKGHFSLIRR